MAEVSHCASLSNIPHITKLIYVSFHLNSPKELVENVIVNMYEGKGDGLEHGNYSGLKLIDQIINIAEKVLDKKAAVFCVC